MNVLHSLRAFVAIALCVVAGSAMAARFVEPTDDVAEVYQLIDARLTLMPEVAAWKWTHQRPIVDEDREAQVLDRMAERAREFGLAPQSIRAVFEAQMSMARAVQAALFEEWRAEGFPENTHVRDLENDLRPALDDLGEKLLAALYWAREDFAQINTSDEIARSLRRIASMRGITAQDLAQLRTVLQAVRTTNARVDVIGKLRVLRIGTTGDYAPFSLEHDGELTGADIELAETLAAQLGLAARFVRTSWSALMDDLQADRFDIAIGGISNTPERAARAEFSTAYHVDGKTPIARCEDRARFSSLSDVDKPNVRVIVNPGGTNERFVREHIHAARIIVHADNRTIFDELVAARADVMITDGIEVELQTKRHRALCRTMSELLTNATKAVMLPRGFALAPDINRWIEADVARGGPQQRMQRAIQRTLELN